MAQESYADFSIIKKYIDQKKIFDQELASYKEQIAELKGQVERLKAELNKKNQMVAQLREKLNDDLSQLAEKDKKINMLEQHVKRLSQQLSQKQAAPRQPQSQNDPRKGGFLNRK